MPFLIPRNLHPPARKAPPALLSGLVCALCAGAILIATSALFYGACQHFGWRVVPILLVIGIGLLGLVASDPDPDLP